MYIHITDVSNIKIEKHCNGEYTKYFHIITLNYHDSRVRDSKFIIEVDESIYNDLLQHKLKNTNTITKRRYFLKLKTSNSANIDIYSGSLEGYKTISLFFGSIYEFDFFTSPNWLLEDITDNEEYFENNLCRKNIEHKLI